MIYKIIFFYLVGIIISLSFKVDIFFLVFIFLSFIILYHVLYGYKSNVFYKGKWLSFIIHNVLLFIVLCISVFYTYNKHKTVSYNDNLETPLNIVGKVVLIDKKDISQKLIIDVESMVDLSDNEQIKNHPELINVNVSSLQKFSLYDKVEINGEIKKDNWQIFYEERPLFFSYEFTNLFYNSSLSVSYPKSIVIVDSQKNIYERAKIIFYSLSETLKNRLEIYMSQPYAGIAEGISLGNQENIIKDIKDIFRASGLIHILVLSGANISFIIMLAWYFLRNLKGSLKTYLVVFGSWIFIFITGLAPPSVRAGVMASASILTEAYGKSISTIYSLLFSLFFLTIINPLTLVFSPSLHLSFLACFGLFVAAPKIEKILKKYITTSFLNFLVSSFVGIFIFTTPYILALTGKSSLFGTLLTFIVEPLILVTTILSFLIIIFSILPIYVADILAVVNTLVIKIILFIATLGANHLPQIIFQIGKLELVIYYSILIFMFLFFDHDKIVINNESK